MCFRIAQIHANNTRDESIEGRRWTYKGGIWPAESAQGIVQSDWKETKLWVTSHFYHSSTTIFLQVAAAVTLTIFLLVQVRKNTQISPDESGDSVAAPVAVPSQNFLPISDVLPNHSIAEQRRKRKRMEDDDVVITGTTPAAVHGPEPLPVTGNPTNWRSKGSC